MHTLTGCELWLFLQYCYFMLFPKHAGVGSSVLMYSLSFPATLLLTV